MKKLYTLLFALFVLATVPAYAQLTCNQDIQVSIGPDCTATLAPDDILEGFEGDDTDYQIELLNGNNQIIGGSLITGDLLGQTIMVRITEIATGNSCWGNVTVEDKQGPTCVDGSVVVNCQADLATVAPPVFIDNCDATPDVTLVDELLIDADICADDALVRQRIYVAYDNFGNPSLPCTQTITINRVAVEFPEDIVFGCDQYAAFPAITNVAPLNDALISGPAVSGGSGIEVFDATTSVALANTGAGQVNVADSPLCNYAVTIADDTLSVCEGVTASFKIIRTFTVLDWCTNTIVTTDAAGNDAEQVIKVVDRIAPVITAAPVTVDANIPGDHPAGCRSTAFIEAPGITESCSDFTVQIFTSIGELDYFNGVDGSQGGTIPAPGLPFGTTTLQYRVTDGCGNTSEFLTQLTVTDLTAPTVICDAITSVSLGADGLAVVPADVFDDGSTDNCCLDRFEVRRMANGCGRPQDVVFGESIAFCCADVSNGPVMVVVRAFDCVGNFSDCMVEIEVEDKIDPSVECLPEITIDCQQFSTQLAGGLATGDGSVLDIFGVPSFVDNCGIALVDTMVQVELNGCNEGFINRFFSATTVDGTQVFCQQTINITTTSNFVVSFPADISLTCETPGDMNFPGPEVFFDDCELVGISSTDQQFDVVADACYKIIRTWEVINWCVVGDEVDQEAEEASEAQLIPILGGPNGPEPNCDLDGDGDCDESTFRDSWTLTAQPGDDQTGTDGAPDTDPDLDPWDGFIRYQQTIKVNDITPPAIDEPADITVCINGPGCTVDFVIPTPDIKDCSPQISVEITGDLTSLDGTVTDVGPGVYTVLFNATDNCGNVATEDLTITVEDCKNPTLFCQDGINISLGDTGEVEVWATDLLKQAFDNCTDSTDLVFSFGADTSMTAITLNCTTQNTFQVDIYVTDEAGNQEFCSTVINVQDNELVCPGALVVLDGTTMTTDGSAVPDVHVSLSDGTLGLMTGTDGAYHFDLLEGADYTVVPSKDDDPTNGVTTYDLVLISKHILGTQPFTAPEQLIAADANNSRSITTLDMVSIRKLILYVSDAFPNNSSWRFVDAAYAFPDAQNPWAETFPELINFNNVAAGDWRADFTAIKVGDVNGSAIPQLTGAGDALDRNGTAWTLWAADRYLEAGERFELTLIADAMAAYQFTLGYDAEVLELAIAPEGQLAAEHTGRPAPGVLTASWNGESDAAPVAVLKGTALRAGLLSEHIRLRKDYTPAAAYAPNGAATPVDLAFTPATTPVALQLSARPNPFGTQTELRFQLPTAGPADLAIYDAAGRRVWAQAGQYSAGSHLVTFERPASLAAGVLLCRLVTEAGVQTQRLVIE